MRVSTRSSSTVVSCEWILTNTSDGTEALSIRGSPILNMPTSLEKHFVPYHHRQVGRTTCARHHHSFLARPRSTTVTRIATDPRTTAIDTMTILRVTAIISVWPMSHHRGTSIVTRRRHHILRNLFVLVLKKNFSVYSPISLTVAYDRQYTRIEHTHTRSHRLEPREKKHNSRFSSRCLCNTLTKIFTRDTSSRRYTGKLRERRVGHSRD